LRKDVGVGFDAAEGKPICRGPYAAEAARKKNLKNPLGS
jgi:hypothetical protein